MQEVTWATNRVVRISGLSARWTGIEIGLLGIATGVRAEARRHPVDKSATTAALATGATTGTADAAARRTTISTTAISKAAAVTHPITITIAMTT